MSDALDSHGTLVQRNGVTVAELRDITPPPLTRNSFDVTPQNENDDAYVVGTVKRRGEMTFAVNFLPSGTTHGKTNGLIKAYNDKTRDAYDLIFPNGSRWIMSGFVVNISTSAPNEGPLTGNVTIRPTGAMVFVD
jgi:hypothetical protein